MFDGPQPSLVQPSPTDSPSGHCIIAGGGIGGLTAALCLGHAGWRITVLEREPTLHELGAGLQISPNAAHILRNIRILDDLDDIAIEPSQLVIHRAQDGKSLITTALGREAEARFGAPFLVMHRGDLQHALFARAEAHPRITIILDRRLADMRENSEAIIAITQSEDGIEHRYEADLLVGADGLWSRARALAGLPAPSRPAGKTAWRALIPREAAPLFAREPEIHLWLGPGGHLVHYPVRGGHQINIVATIDDPWHEEGWSAPGNPDLIASHFHHWNAQARALVGAAVTWNRWALIDRAPEHRWSRTRMTLLGDAAHPMMPFLAQGASQSIEDAATLAKLLGKERTGAVPGGKSIHTALKAYDAARIPRTARIQRAARRQASLYHLEGPLADLRDATMRLSPKGWLFGRFSWIYAHRADT